MEARRKAREASGETAYVSPLLFADEPGYAGVVPFGASAGPVARQPHVPARTWRAGFDSGCLPEAPGVRAPPSGAMCRAQDAVVQRDILTVKRVLESRPSSSRPCGASSTGPAQTLYCRVRSGGWAGVADPLLPRQRG